MIKDSSKLFEIRCTKELDMRLSDCTLLINLLVLTKNVSSINDKLTFLAAFSQPLIFIRYTYLSHKFVKSEYMCFIFIVVEDLEYILKFSVYQNSSSSFKKCLTINVRSFTSSICTFCLHCLTLTVTS